MTSIVRRMVLAQFVCVTVATYSTIASPLRAEQVDDTKTYRIETQIRGFDSVLEIFDGGAKNDMAHVTETSDAPAQLWKLRRDGDWYRLTTALRGANMCLDVINRGPLDNQLMLTKCANYSSQLWKLTRDGNWLRLTTQMRGDKMCLDVMRANGANGEAFLAPCTNVTAQFWKLQPYVQKLVATADIASTQSATDAAAPQPASVAVLRPAVAATPTAEPTAAATSKSATQSDPIVAAPLKVVALGPSDGETRTPTRAPYVEPAKPLAPPAEQPPGPQTRYRAGSAQLATTPATAPTATPPAAPAPPTPPPATLVVRPMTPPPAAPQPAAAQAPAQPATLSAVPAAPAAEPPIADAPIQPREFQLVQNRGRTNKYLSAERGPVESSRIDTRAWGAQWQIEKIDGYVRFQNRWQTGRYLNLQNGRLDVAKVEPGWQSAMWTMESVRDDTYRICNRLQPDICLHTQKGKVEAGTVDPKWQSAMWRLLPAPDRNAGQRAAPPPKVQVTTRLTGKKKATPAKHTTRSLSFKNRKVTKARGTPPAKLRSKKKRR